MTPPDQPSAPVPGRGHSSLIAKVREKLDAGLTALKSDSDRGRTQRAAITVFLIRIFSAAIAFASQVVLARWMGSFEYGIFVFVWVWVLILNVISSAGINVSMMRFVPQYTEQGATDLLRGILFRGRLIVFLLASLYSGLALGVLALWPGIMEDYYLLPAYIVFFCVPVIVLTDIQDCIGRAYSWMPVALIPPYVLRPLLLLICMCGAALLDFDMVASTAAGCAVISAVLSYLVQTVLLQRRLRDTVPAGPRAYDTKFWLLTAFPILLVEGIDLLLYNTDVLLISHYMTPSDAGIYFASLKTIGLVSFVNYAVGSSIAHRIAALKARGDTAGLATFVRDAAAWTFWPSLIALVGLLIVGKPLLWLFGSEFTSGYGVMAILAVGILLRSAVGPAEFVMNMMGEQKTSAKVLFFSVILNVALNIALIPSYGLLGAAAATSASRVVASLLFYMAAKRRLNLDISILSSMRSSQA